VLVLLRIDVSYTWRGMSISQELGGHYSESHPRQCVKRVVGNRRGKGLPTPSLLTAASSQRA
jgi:hypothetical protein